MRFALAGNPNSGKTTLFNNLTGATARVGNWPGVTVEQKIGVYKKLSEPVEIVDLPGIYSLSPYTPEEVVAREYILDEKPDLIINIVDATNLERNLYLTTQVIETDTPVVVALNFMDEVEKSGDKINIENLSKKLGVPVIGISALKKNNIHKLMEVAYGEVKSERKGHTVLKDSIISEAIANVEKLYIEKGIDNPLFRAIKLIEGDNLEVNKRKEFLPQVTQLKLKVDTGDFYGDYEAVVADARYKYITKHYAAELKKAKKEKISKSDKVDKILTHRFWGIPIFLFIMLLIFHFTFSENFLLLRWAVKDAQISEGVERFLASNDGVYSPGVIFHTLVGEAWGELTGLIEGAMPEGTWYTSLVVNGLFEGVGAVISFIPLILILFFFLSILEDTGYMARVAFILDRAFRGFGLSGRAFLPLLTCFGCAIPGIMGTRTLEDASERKRAILLSPFFSCGAKLPIWAAFGGVFALHSNLNATGVVAGMYIIGIVVAILGSLFLKKTFVKGETPPFIMELPEYRTPQFRTVMLHLGQNLKHYLLRAGTIIAGSIVVIWVLTNVSFRYGFVDADQSMISVIAKPLSYIFIPLGWGYGDIGWKLTVAAFTGLIAKEMVVATMGMFGGMGEDAGEAFDLEAGELNEHPGMAAMILGVGGLMFGPQTAIPAMFAFLTFNLLSVPCMAAVAAARAEFVLMEGKKKGRRSTILAVLFWLLGAYVVSMIVFWIGMFIAVAKWYSLFVLLAVVIASVIAILVKKDIIKIKKKGAKSV
ncbi:MAG: ferrous iron transport protein B [Christensenellales bacterium]|jgi:ferrous iron transport protein B|nr:ferrous iron transport protein B [Clostridiales bacterium]